MQILLRIVALILLASNASVVAGQIVFSAAGDLFLIDADGTGRRQLTDGPGERLAPTWSPDGSRIAFIWCLPDTEPCDIWLIDEDGLHEERLAVDPPAAISDLAWSPEGTRLALSSPASDGGLWVTTIASGAMHKLVDGVVGNLSWSADGLQLAFGFGLFSAVWMVDADGTNRSLLFDRARDPAFSPDGIRMAMTLQGTDSAPIGIMDITDPQRDYLPPTDQLAVPSLGSSWAPTGQQLVYQAGWQDEASLWIINADGSEHRWLTHGQQPAWSPARENQAPVLAGVPCHVALNRDNPPALGDLEALFSDPDGDPLTYTIISSDAAVGRVHVYISTLILAGHSAGQSTITVSAADPDGAAATTQFQAVVSASLSFPKGPRPPFAGDFDLNLAVDFDDFFLFSDHYGLSSNDPGWDSRFDMSPNLVIDFDDFFVFADNFGYTAVAQSNPVLDWCFP